MKNAQSARIHRHYLHFCLRHIKSQGNKELAEAYHACEGEPQQFPHLFERRPDWLVVMWSAANVSVRPNSMQTKTLKSGWRTIRPIIVGAAAPPPPAGRRDCRQCRLQQRHPLLQPRPAAKLWDCRQRRAGCRSKRGNPPEAGGQQNRTIADLLFCPKPNGQKFVA